MITFIDVEFIVYNKFTYATRTLEMREIMNVARPNIEQCWTSRRFPFFSSQF